MSDTTHTPHFGHDFTSAQVIASWPLLRQRSRSARPAAESLDALALCPHNGGLVLIGPTSAEMRGIDALLTSPEVDTVQACGARLNNWITSPEEVLILTREVSTSLRHGRTAVVYLDSHRGYAPPLSEDAHDFVAWRLGNIMIGLADSPAYIAVHGEHMAHGLLDAVGDTDMDIIGAIGADVAVTQLTDRTMFPGVPLAVTPRDQQASAVMQAVDWFEARRVRS